MKRAWLQTSAVRSVLALLLVLSTLLSVTACNDDSDTDTTRPSGSVDASLIDGTESTEEPIETKREVSQADALEIQAYLEKVINGPFREFASFPDFTNVNQLPPVALAGSNLLQDATSAVGMSSFPRSSYEMYLQEYLNPDITLPSNADYQIVYDLASDSFSSSYVPEQRNFTPFSVFLDPVVSQSGDTVHFDAYELSYDYVNSATGQTERSNPIARMVVDGVTIGFSAPISRRDLHLLDHRPLAKTRFTLTATTEGGWNLLSKTKLERDESFKISAASEFSNVNAIRGTAVDLPSGRLNIRDWASTESQIIGTLEVNTVVWVVNCLPSTGFLLGAPAATSAVFNYDLGFGFMSGQYIR